MKISAFLLQMEIAQIESHEKIDTKSDLEIKKTSELIENEIKKMNKKLDQINRSDLEAILLKIQKSNYLIDF